MGLLGFMKRGKKTSGMPPKGFPPMPKPHDIPQMDSDDDFPELPPIEDTDIDFGDESPRQDFPKQDEEFPEPVAQAQQPVQAAAPKPRPMPPRGEVEILSHHYSQGNHLFVDSNDYKDLVVCSETVKEKIKDCEDILQNLHKIKDKKSEVLKKWQVEFVDIQRKLSYLDKALFENR